MKTIDISVVIAAKDEQTHIKSALESILGQEGVEFELILVDDNSTDETFSIAETIGKRHPNFFLHRNPHKGKCSAFNYGVSLARGQFVCIFAGDDIMPPSSLAARWQKVRHLPSDKAGVGLCKLVTMSEIKRLDGHVVPKGAERGNMSGVSPLMNRLALGHIFPVPEHLPNEDTWMELFLVHSSDWNIVHSGIIGCQWRVHSGNSINFLVDFPNYNKKITARLCAYALFLDQHGATLTEQSRKSLKARVDCEHARSSGDLWGVLFSRVRLVDKLRALSITNSFFYEIRRRLYGLLSGW